MIHEAPLKAESLSPLERWFVLEAPLVRATRERAHIFQNELQKCVQSGVSMASLPCGLMHDLLSLDFTGQTGISLTGIDIDPESIDGAKSCSEKLTELRPDIEVHFLEKDAFDLSLDQKFNVLVSNGLNIYVAEEAHLLQLYREFYKALLPGGTLITSFITLPPTLSEQSTWKMEQLEQRDLLQQKIIMQDLIGAPWMHFRTQEETRRQLELCGFQNINFIYDMCGMFPTVTAKRSKKV